MELTGFVGRERELESIRRLLTGARLLTLVGTGGVGKTRLALELVHEREAEYPGGVFVVELAPLDDPALVAQAVASALNVQDEGTRSVIESLVSALRDRRVLLVLDNCEHLILACGELVHTLLRSCPELHILATSREPLMLGGDGGELGQSDAVRKLRQEVRGELQSQARLPATACAG